MYFICSPCKAQKDKFLKIIFPVITRDIKDFISDIISCPISANPTYVLSLKFARINLQKYLYPTRRSLFSSYHKNLSDELSDV